MKINCHFKISSMEALELREGGAGSLSNTLWPRLRSTFVPSGMLIHPAVWPQHTLAEKWGVSLLGRGNWVPI